MPRQGIKGDLMNDNHWFQTDTQTINCCLWATRFPALQIKG